LAIGINSGPVVGGVVGRQKFLYDLWGDTVTIASRLANGQSNVVLVTKPVHDRLGDLHPFGPQQEIEIRGKGRVQFWKLEVG
jgi:class 3 adenylate cyclase